MSSVNYNAKHYSLTYPQSSFDLNEYFLFCKNSYQSLTKIVVSRELHQDNNIHHHVYLGFSRRHHFRGADHFDYRGHHPNIQVCRNVEDWCKYITKDGEFLSRSLLGDRWVEWSLGSIQDFRGIVESSSSKDEFLSKLYEWNAEKLALNLERFEYFANWKFKAQITPFKSNFTPESFSWTPKLQLWYGLNITLRPERPNSLILVGPSRTGKTQWARSLSTHWYMNGYFMLDLFNTEADYGIFDDLNPEHLARNYKQWLGCQQSFVTTDKYRKKCIVNFGKPVIVLFNHPDYIKFLSLTDNEWIHANVLIETLELGFKLY